MLNKYKGSLKCKEHVNNKILVNQFVETNNKLKVKLLCEMKNKIILF